MRGVTPSSWGPVALRILGIGLLVLLLWNPPISRPAPHGGAPVVLLDASLSMDARPGLWRQALDTARALARGGVIWRFGEEVEAFDTTPPTDGASRLGPALAAAAAQGGPIVVVTDGAINDLAALPADLFARSRLVVLKPAPPPGPDAFVAGVEGPHQVSPGDTVTLRVTFGRSGRREAGRGTSEALLLVSLGGRMLGSRTVTLPDSGTIDAELTLPASRFPAQGWSSLDVGIQWAGDPEPRDDHRAFPIEVTSEPAAVVIGAPPDWDSKFLARALGDVARVPVKYFTQIAAGKWNEGVTLAPVPADQVSRAIAGARLVVEVGDPTRWPALPSTTPAVLAWNTGSGAAGDWYLAPSPASPVTGALSSLPWDSLPPMLAVLPTLPESGSVPVLDARLARRGEARSVVTVRETGRGGGRRGTVNLTGLYRWDFRGGASQQAYRAVIAGLVDWLLGGSSNATDWARPDSFAVADGLSLPWRWTGPGAPRDLPISFSALSGSRTDTLRFGADGRANLRLPPGVYRYSLSGGGARGRGMVVVDRYSAEWHAAPVLSSQAGRPVNARVVFDWRERWWLFALAVLAFAGEWYWRRRLGLP